MENDFFVIGSDTELPAEYSARSGAGVTCKTQVLPTVQSVIKSERPHRQQPVTENSQSKEQRRDRQADQDKPEKQQKQDKDKKSRRRKYCASQKQEQEQEEEQQQSRNKRLTEQSAQKAVLKFPKVKKEQSKILQANRAIPSGTKRNTQIPKMYFNPQDNRLVVGDIGMFLCEPIPFGLLLACRIDRQQKSLLSSELNLSIYIAIQKSKLAIVTHSEGKFKIEMQVKGKAVEIGYVIPNFLGTQFHVLDKDNRELAFVQFESNVFGLKGQRKMKVFTPALCLCSKKMISYQYQKGTSVLKEIWKSKLFQSVLMFRNKELQGSSLQTNYYGQVKLRSVKNFILKFERTQTETMLFGKTESNSFLMDVRYPLSFLQGIGIAIASIAKKIAVE